MSIDKRTLDLLTSLWDTVQRGDGVNTIAMLDAIRALPEPECLTLIQVVQLIHEELEAWADGVDLAKDE